MSPQRGTNSALVLPCLDARSVSVHLADITRQIAPGAHAVLMLDGAGFHIVNDLEIPGNMPLLRLPSYSPKLNPIENVWEYLRGHKLADKVLETYDDVVSASCDAGSVFANDTDRFASITTRHGQKSIFRATGMTGFAKQGAFGHR